MRWFEEMGLAGKLLVAAGLILLLYLGVHLFHRIRYSKPRRFRFEGSVYLWQPDSRPGFWFHRYKYGHFVHEDGSPIADKAYAARIMRSWVESFNVDVDAGA